MKDLILAIRNKQKVPFLESLEERYGGGLKKKKVEKSPKMKEKAGRRIPKK